MLYKNIEKEIYTTALYLLDGHSADLIYGPSERADIARLVDVIEPIQTQESIRNNWQLLQGIELIFSGWGMSYVDESFLAAAPNLQAIFYGAGSVRGFVTDALWDRGIIVSSAYAANAVPVAEYTIAAILFSLKHAWQYAFAAQRTGTFPPRIREPGAYGTTVGLISMGMVARAVRERLRAFDVKVVVYDPFLKVEEARKLGVELLSLEQLFREADVISLHSPWLKETENMITESHFAAMKSGASFINTARGAVVHETSMIKVLQQRPEIYAILDVTWPEPPVKGSPLYTLPNVMLTPHIAGSMGNECRRMGRYMVEELQRYLVGEPLHWQITREKATIMA